MVDATNIFKSQVNYFWRLFLVKGEGFAADASQRIASTYIFGAVRGQECHTGPAGLRCRGDEPASCGALSKAEVFP
jgi:hypothetical protein